MSSNILDLFHLEHVEQGKSTLWKGGKKPWESYPYHGGAAIKIQAELL